MGETKREGPFCVKCGARLKLEAPGEARVLCVCGERAREWKIEFNNELTIEGSFSAKALSKTYPKRRGRFAWVKSRTEVFRKTGRRNRVMQVGNRREDTYYEHIEDEETGEVVRHIEEPLSDHRGRGSAQRRDDESDAEQDEPNE